MLAYLVAVVLDRAASPLIKTQIRRRDPDLPGDERDDLVGELRAARREAAMPRIELQQEDEPSRVAPRLPATRSRSSTSTVQCSTSSSMPTDGRSMTAHHAADVNSLR